MSRITRVASKSRKKGAGDSSREASAESNGEENDPVGAGPDQEDTDDAASLSLPSARVEPAVDDTGSPVQATNAPPKRRPAASAVQRKELGALEEKGYEGEGSEASTYDGDVSSTNLSIARRVSSNPTQGHSAAHYNARAAGAVRPTVTAAHSAASTISVDADAPMDSPASPVPLRSSAGSSSPASSLLREGSSSKPAPFHHPAPHGLLSRIPAAELQKRMLDAIAGQGPDGQVRSYKINPPPIGRPIRIYADGVYDLFHYAHALQLRQAKLFFPEVYLLVGVVSDELVKQYKAQPVLKSEERYESVRNCKWVDEVIEDAPWIIDADFLDKHQIDYVAHDEEPYVSAGSEDVYSLVKERGQFIPTRRTSGISTSELLERIVAGYREGDYDNKLLKIGREDLCSSKASSIQGHASGSRPPSHPPSPH